MPTACPKIQPSTFDVVVSRLAGMTPAQRHLRAQANSQGGNHRCCGLAMMVVLAVSAPSIIAGIGLLYFKPWARVLTIILSVINLFSVPFGTALGIYGPSAVGPSVPETSAGVYVIASRQ